MEVVDRFGPIGIDLGHIHPGHEGAGEGVQDALLRLVNLRDAQDVVDVGDDGQTSVGDEEGGGIADCGATAVFAGLSVDVHPLQLG